MDKILMLYRGRDASQRVASATESKYKKSAYKDHLDMVFINLDKRNLTKLLNSDNSFTYVFVYHDEEKAIDTLSEFFKKDFIKTYTRADSTDIGYCYGGNKVEYTLFKTITDMIKFESEDYIILNKTNVTLSKKNLDIFEASKYKSDCNSYIGKDKTKLLEKLESDILKNIDNYEVRIKNLTSNISKENVRLKKVHMKLNRMQ